jgi:hypothetical protein
MYATGLPTVQTLKDEKWAAISNLLGEALLDVERTFMNVVDHSAAARTLERHISPECLQDYLEAWAVLDQAHMCLLAFFSKAGADAAVSGARSDSLPH